MKKMNDEERVKFNALIFGFLLAASGSIIRTLQKNVLITVLTICALIVISIFLHYLIKISNRLKKINDKIESLENKFSENSKSMTPETEQNTQPLDNE